MKRRFHNLRACFRYNKELAKRIGQLMNSFPEDYETESDVVRAGIITLYRWKFEHEKMIEEEMSDRR